MRYLMLGLMLTVAAPAAGQDAFEQWKKQQEQEFQAFRDARDREFSALLDEAWQFLNRKEPVKAYARPKADEIPVAPAEKPAPVKIKPAGDVKPPVTNSAAQAPAPAADPKPVALPAGIPQLHIAAFGLESDYPYDPVWKTTTLARRDQAGIAAFFTRLAKSNYEPAVQAILQHRKTQQLNDWAVGVAVESFAGSLAPGADERALLTWFLLTKAGYAARIGYSDQGISLLIPSTLPIYAAPFFELGGRRFYVLRFTAKAGDPGSVYTYEGNYPGADRVFDFALDRLPGFPADEAGRTVHFTWKETRHEIPLRYSRQAVAFMQGYPQAELPLYFRADVSGPAAASLAASLKPLVKDLPELEAVNLLLRFVQTAFAYKTDDDQFGYEKYFFVEETLHYPYSDCEDRTILFAWLVRTLLGNEVVGLKYPGHLAAAVAFRNVPAGDGFQLGGKTFTVCDPTYINADAGMTMPDFRAESPQVIRITP